MTLEKAAEGFAAFGSPSRLAIFLELVKKGRKGSTIKDLQIRCDIPASTLAHHLRLLSAAEVITQERQARTVVCTVNFERVDYLVAYLMKNCCSEADDTDQVSVLEGQSQ